MAGSLNIPPSLEGRVFELATGPHARQAVDAAFDYRGDATVELHSGRTVVGYVCNRDWARGDGVVDVLPRLGGPSERILVCDIARISLTGRDSAAATPTHPAGESNQGRAAPRTYTDEAA